MSKLNPITQQASSKAINAAIDKVRKHFATGNDLIHSTACMVIEHAANFGDVTGAARLCNALPKSSIRRSIIAKWFGLHSPIVCEVKGGEFTAHKAGPKNEKVCQTWEVERAKVNPFWEMPEAQKDEVLFTAEDVTDSISRIISRYSKALKEKKIANDDEEKVKALVLKLSNFNASLKVDTGEITGAATEPALIDAIVNTEGLRKVA